MPRSGIPLALLAVILAGSAQSHQPPHLVALTMYVRLDQVAAAGDGSSHGKVGDLDRIRLTYDADAVDPTTLRVRLVNFEHLPPRTYTPPRPDTTTTPINDSWLDLRRAPYRLHFRASVDHGEAIVIDVDENSRRLTIYRQADPAAVMLSGAYWIDPTSKADQTAIMASPVR